MSKRNIMLALNQTPDGSCPKNGFDLAHHEYHSAKMGQFVPVGFIETVPDGEYDVGVDNYTFTVPCNTASLAKMKENFYFLYVPYSQLVNNVYSFFPQRKDNQSALDYNYDKIPYFNLGDVVEHCILGACEDLDDLYEQSWHYNEIHGFNVYAGALRLLDMLGYGCYLDILQAYKNNDLTKASMHSFCSSVLNQSKPNILRIAAYQKAWYCYFRNPIFDTGTGQYNDITPRAFNFDDVVMHTAGNTESYDVLAHRDIDNFIWESLQLRYVGYKKDIFTAFMPGTQYGAVSSLKLNSSISLTGLSGSVSGTTGTDSDRWSTVADSFTEDGDLEGDQGQARFSAFNTFTLGNVRRATVVGQGGEDPTYGYDLVHHDHTFSGSVSGLTGSVPANATLFDVLQLVEAQAIQKWKQKSMMAGQRGINQYRAHYGVVPRHMEDHYPDFLGSVDNDILIDRVISQANTASDVDDSTNLGDLGGRGYGASPNRTFHCKSTEHGVIIICAAVIPENVYSSYGLDRANQLISYSDFWQPEYQNIGLEVIPKFCLDAASRPTETTEIHPSCENWEGYRNTVVLGFAPRNYQLKQYPSRVHGLLNPARLVEWSFDTGVLPYGFSSLQHFVMPRLDLNSTMQLDSEQHTMSCSQFHLARKNFYVSPSMADSVFIVNADSFEDTDQFIRKTRIICNSSQPLSVIGLPQF